MAYMAWTDLAEEYAIIAQNWERNPTKTALAAGVKALRACIVELERA